ncbi:MAG: hypothetical protein WC389_16860 [Lutibacter sp.]|jgi:hypothetical protein
MKSRFEFFEHPEMAEANKVPHIFVARCRPLGLTAYGDTPEEANTKLMLMFGSLTATEYKYKDEVNKNEGNYPISTCIKMAPLQVVASKKSLLDIITYSAKIGTCGKILQKIEYGKRHGNGYREQSCHGLLRLYWVAQ